jgi:hypothetical protein
MIKHTGKSLLIVSIAAAIVIPTRRTRLGCPIGSSDAII